jgi:streptogramin lyase
VSARSHTRGSTHVSVRFSPYLLAVALTPILVQTTTPLSCDTTLSEFELIVHGENRIVRFDPSQRSYNVSLPLGTDEVRVRAVSTDPDAQLSFHVLIDGERFSYLGSPVVGGANVGRADLVVPLPPGSSILEAWVRPSGSATDHYDVGIQIRGGIDTGGLVYESCSAEQTGGAGLPLAIDLDSNGDAWVLGEFHTALQHIVNTDPCPQSTAITIPINGNLFRYDDGATSMSVLGESVVWDSNDQIVWFSQGGANLEDTGANHSRVGSYHPGTTTFKMYNLPGNRNEAQGLYWDQARNWVWVAEAGLYSDLSAIVPPDTAHQATIIAFDPDTAAWNNLQSTATWAALDTELCTGAETPTADGCFKRYELPTDGWGENVPETGAFGTAHLVADASGFVWFTNFWGNSIGRLDPATEAVIICPQPAHIGTQGPAAIVGSGPWEIKISPDGKYVVWTEFFDSTISRMLISNADNVGCQSLDGHGDNPCVEEMLVPLDLSIENIHSIAYDTNGDLWFGTGMSYGTAHGVVYSTLGFVHSDWSGVTLLYPTDFTPNFNPNGDVSYSGIAIDQATGEIWVNEGPGPSPANPGVGRWAPLSRNDEL